MIQEFVLGSESKLVISYNKVRIQNVEVHVSWRSIFMAKLNFCDMQKIKVAFLVTTNLKYLLMQNSNQ